MGDFEEEYTFENIFGAHAAKCIDIIPTYRSLGTFEHRLFHTSSDVDDESKHGNDIVDNLIQRKKNFHRLWLYKRKSLKKFNGLNDIIKFQKQLYSTEGNLCIQVPEYIPNCVEFTTTDPDKNFFGLYNWFYTGGCIQHFNFNNNHYLAYSEGKKKDRLHVAPLKCDDQLWCIDKSGIQNVTPSPGKEIYQILYVEKPSNNFIGVRQRDSCVVYNFSENGRFNECFNLVDISLASFDISSVHEELCSIDVNQNVCFWDIHSKELPVPTYFPSDNPRCDKWHNLLYSTDPSVISVAGRKSVKWMERRSSNVTSSVQLSSLKGSVKDEVISLHFASKRNPCLIYVSTDANLFLLDIRSPSSVMECWSHYLTSAPLYSCVIPYNEDNEIVCIGNQYPGNVVMAFSSKSEIWPLVKIPSRVDSLFSLQASGLCLDPSVMPRMTLGLTGLTYVRSEKSSDVELLTQTAASDIFSQSLFDQNTEIKSDNLNGLVTTKEILHASERWNMEKLYKKLPKTDIQPNPLMKRRTCKQPWQLSKQELLEYKDALAPIILEVWDVDKVNGKPSISGEQKVNAWLDSSFNTVYSSQGSQFL